MSELKKTIYFGGAALILILAALISTPTQITPEAFIDQGELFFPEFTDPNIATSLEVIDFDDATGSARPFKVMFKNGRWTIPSHHEYQADGEDRLAKTAAGVIDIRKDDFRTDNVVDHEACGVIDPLDEKLAGLSGRGKRVTLKAQGGEVLADFIVGKEVLSRPGFRFVRVPDQNRVYACRMEIDISTRFEDWIKRDMLEIESADIIGVTLKDYSINERTLSVDQRDNLVLALNDNKWSMRGLSSSKMIDTASMGDFVKALDELAIVGVRPKPAGLSSSLSQNAAASISRSDQVSLQKKGYYLSRDGQLLSNEGELNVSTSQGVTFTLRFGEILYGSGIAVSAGSKESDAGSGTGENRYLFVTADFNEKFFGSKPPAPTNENFRTMVDSVMSDQDRSNRERQAALDGWNNRTNEGRSLAATMNARFSDWYYVISGTDFEKLDVGQSELIKSKSSN